MLLLDGSEWSEVEVGGGKTIGQMATGGSTDCSCAMQETAFAAEAKEIIITSACMAAFLIRLQPRLKLARRASSHLCPNCSPQMSPVSG